MSEPEVARADSTDLLQHFEIHQDAWSVRPTQVSGGAFRGRIAFVRTDSVTVYRERWNHRLAICGESPPGFVLVGSALDSSTQIHWCGSGVHQRRVAYSPPSGEIDFTTSEHADHVVALIREDVLARYLGVPEIKAATAARHLESRQTHGCALIATLDSVVTRYTRRPDLLQDPRSRETLQAEVLGAVAACARWGPSPPDGVSRRNEAFRDAVAHMEQWDEPISIPDLAAEVGVSQRTLEYAFRERLGVTPVQFLHRARLNGAHRDLRSAEPGSTTVTAVAGKWGIYELGRFAAEHQRLFGTTPSEALARTGSRGPRISL